jgi:hypothetical protein
LPDACITTRLFGDMGKFRALGYDPLRMHLIAPLGLVHTWELHLCEVFSWHPRGSPALGIEAGDLSQSGAMISRPDRLRTLFTSMGNAAECATKRIDEMGGKPPCLYRQALSPWGVAPGGCNPDVKELPLKGTGGAP